MKLNTPFNYRCCGDNSSLAGAAYRVGASQCDAEAL